MKQAWENTVRVPISSNDLIWNSTKVSLPLGPHLVEAELIAQLESQETDSFRLLAIYSGGLSAGAR